MGEYIEGPTPHLTITYGSPSDGSTSSNGSKRKPSMSAVFLLGMLATIAIMAALLAAQIAYSQFFPKRWRTGAS